MKKDLHAEEVSSHHSLFVGRWQPFHAGHKALIETVLRRGKPVVVAIRDTSISHTNPYTTHERWVMIHDSLKEWGSLVKIVVIPDIDEVCYGRDVGYEVRKIDMEEDIERISGTKTRKENPPMKQIVWLTGQSGAGKTTLANLLATRLPGSVVLDGDEMRASISISEGFSREDRHQHNLRVARLALVLAKRSLVIVSVIAPYRETRAEIDALIKPIWVYVRRTLPTRTNHPYEEPESPHITVDCDTTNPDDIIIDIVRQMRQHN